MILSQIRANARESLTGKWGKAALLVLSFGAIFFGISFILNLIPLIGPIAYLVISFPLSFGFIASFMKLKRGEDVAYTEFLNIGFSNLGKVWGILGHTILKMIIPFILIGLSVAFFAFSVGGALTGAIYNDLASSDQFSTLALLGLIAYVASVFYATIKGYLYSLSFYILFDNPNKTSKEIVNESQNLMKGNRWKYFSLGFTFIGWIFLAIIPFYIGFLWLIPYIQVAMICFYEDLANKSDSNPIVAE